MSKSRVIKVGAVTAALALLVSFQNCSKNKASSDASLASAAATTPNSIDIGLTDDPGVPVAKDAHATKALPVLADRYYIDALFTKIFGPTAAATDQAKVRNDAVNFGVPCSLYEDYDAPNAKGVWVSVDAARTCSFSLQSYLSVQMDAGAQVARQAQLAHACSDLTTNDTTLKHALGLISSDPIPASTEENVTKAFKLFYRNHPPPTTKVIQSLMVIAPATGATLDSWRLVIDDICVSSHWQVL